VNRKRVFSILFLLWGLPLILALGVGVWVSHAGMIAVNVVEHRPGGDEVHVKVPGALVEMALPFVPDVVCMDASGEMEKWGPVLKSICGELRSMDDGVLVEVSGRRENVLIHKKGGSVIIDVDSDDETVHITMPLGTVSAVLSKFQGGHANWKCRIGDSGA